MAGTRFAFQAKDFSFPSTPTDPSRPSLLTQQVKKFAQKVMKTSDVRVDVKLNKAIWSKGIRNVSRRARIPGHRPAFFHQPRPRVYTLRNTEVLTVIPTSRSHRHRFPANSACRSPASATTTRMPRYVHVRVPGILARASKASTPARRRNPEVFSSMGAQPPSSHIRAARPHSVADLRFVPHSNRRTSTPT